MLVKFGGHHLSAEDAKITKPTEATIVSFSKPDSYFGVKALIGAKGIASGRGTFKLNDTYKESDMEIYPKDFSLLIYDCTIEVADDTV